MKLRTLFIGIDKHISPKILELTAGRRDATALWALFSDTLGDGDPVLLVNEQATIAAVRGALESRLRAAEPDDVIIVAFSGHGTRDHRLVVYDTDPVRLSDTTMEMAELGTLFRESQARAILCIVDCCFSGHAPARVFEDSPVPRSVGDPLPELAGKGRLLLAASSSQEEALELSGHGLLTEALLHVLRESPGPVDLVAAMGPIMERVRSRAAALVGTGGSCPGIADVRSPPSTEQFVPFLEGLEPRRDRCSGRRTSWSFKHWRPEVSITWTSPNNWAYIPGR